MKLVVIFGPEAVGKMSVGYELATLTGMKLFHNHMTVDLALNFFEFGHPGFNRLVSDFRKAVFEEVAASDLPGLIFTFTWALDLEADKAFIDRSCEIFRAHEAQIYFVELEAELFQRLERNESTFRLTHKLSKRDVEKSRDLLLKNYEQHRFNSNDDFFYQENYLRIENTNLSAYDAAQRIADVFNFPRVNDSNTEQERSD